MSEPCYGVAAPADVVGPPMSAVRMASVAFDAGRVDGAYASVGRAVARVGPRIDDEELGPVVTLLVSVCQLAVSDEMWRGLRTVLAGVRSRWPEHLRLLEASVRRDGAPTAEVLGDVDRAVGHLVGEGDPQVVVFVAAAAIAVDRGRGCVPALRRVAHQEGRDLLRVLACALTAQIAQSVGDHDEARAAVEVGLGLCRDREHLPYAMLLRSLRALSSAVAGPTSADDTVPGLTEEALRWAGTSSRGSDLVALTARWALAREALVRSDPYSAYRHFLAMTDGGGLPALVTRCPVMLFDLVEAVVGSAHEDLARACVGWAEGGTSDRRDLIRAGASALVAGADAASAWRRAVDRPGADRWPFELARIRLAYAEYLREIDDVDAAQEQADAALTVFAALGAEPWTERARGLLRVSGAVETVPTPRQRKPLTSQEEKVAALAATGMTNRAIARELHLSARTIASHLRHVFEKIGVTRRAQLRDALSTA